jgi:hypothetical protein
MCADIQLIAAASWRIFKKMVFLGMGGGDVPYRNADF